MRKVVETFYMPGIAVIVSRTLPEQVCRSQLAAMVGSMMHEPFYAAQQHSVSELGVYVGWVAQEDSFASGQPFQSGPGDVALYFSGECYIDDDTRSRLQAQGRRPGEGAGDWLISLYMQHGAGFIKLLNGLFCGLLVDKRERRVILFNDRFGMDRVYFSESTDGWYFASEAKALLRVLPDTRSLDWTGVAQFLAFGCTLEWRSLFDHVGVLPGGAQWTFDRGVARKGTYFSPSEWEEQETLDGDEYETQFSEVFRNALPRYFESNTTTGISLTGGLDTRMMLACLPDLRPSPVCYTFDGESGQTVDSRLAARVANTCGLDHQLLRLGPDFFKEFAALADRTVFLTDGCSGVLGSHEVYLNRIARQVAPVRLTGNFGSEVLRSMSTFKPRALADDLPHPDLRAHLKEVEMDGKYHQEHPVAFATFKEIPWSLWGNFSAAGSQLTIRTPYLDNEVVALAFRAPRALRTSAAQALRLVRDQHSALSEISTDRGFRGDGGGIANQARHLVAELGFRWEYHTNEGLPDWLSPLDGTIQRASRGLRFVGTQKYLHYRRWFREKLSTYLQDRCSELIRTGSPIWDMKFVSRMASDHIQGRSNFMLEINAVLSLEAVQRLIVQAEAGQAAPAVADAMMKPKKDA